MNVKITSASEFGIVMSNKDGLKPYCKPCESKRHNIWVDSDPERIIKRKLIVKNGELKILKE